MIVSTEFRPVDLAAGFLVTLAGLWTIAGWCYDLAGWAASLLF